MEIKYRNIILRDRIKIDIENWVRWNTVEVEWMDWDGPDIPSDPFDETEFRKNVLKSLEKPKDGTRWSFEIETAEGIHLGKVSSYQIDKNWKYLDEDEYHNGIGPALGIGICESTFWSKGYGSQALAAFVRYLLTGRAESISANLVREYPHGAVCGKTWICRVQPFCW